MRVTVVHWRPEEAAPCMEILSAAGFDATLDRPTGGNLSSLRGNVPDVYILDLSRLPSHSKEVAGVLMQGKATRHVPVVFAGGAPEKVEKIREVFPQVLFGEWKDIPALLKSKRLKATPIAPPAQSSAPGAMAGYSGTPTAKKLGITPGSTLTVIGAPDEYPECLDLPADVTILRTAGRPSRRVLLFVDRFADLAGRFRAATRSVSTEKGSGLWIVWPKQASGVPTDVNGELVRLYGLDNGWVDYKVCAVDKIWSGLLFSRKKE